MDSEKPDIIYLNARSSRFPRGAALFVIANEFRMCPVFQDVKARHQKDPPTAPIFRLLW